MENHQYYNGVRKPRKWARRLRKVLQYWRIWRSPRHRQQLTNFKDEKKRRDKNMLSPSKFDRSKWGCPKCGFPIDYSEEETEQGNYCACGVWVALPNHSPVFGTEGNNIEKCKYCNGSSKCQRRRGWGGDFIYLLHSYWIYLRGIKRECAGWGGDCKECFGTGECTACLGTGTDMEEEIEAHLLYRSSQ